MGLLDDAIREHLDLKRRRGADPTEVARLEHEALGPVRRDTASSEPADEHHEHAPEPSSTAEPHAAAHAEAHPHPADEGDHPDDATHVLAPEDRHEPPHGDPFREPAAELGGAAAPAVREPADADRAEPAAPVPSAAGAEGESPDPRHSDIVHQPTTEFRVEDHHDDEDEDERPVERPPAQPGGGPDEDVLEETPEFLQETPEHDRLWFEQRPPRDFDFDG